jgi:hypothetical protein
VAVGPGWLFIGLKGLLAPEVTLGAEKGLLRCGSATWGTKQLLSDTAIQKTNYYQEETYTLMVVQRTFDGK